MQQVFELPDTNSAMKVTIEHWYSPDENKIDGIGVEPTIEMEDNHIYVSPIILKENLQYGSTGNQVLQLKNYLKLIGYNVDIEDNNYDLATQEAVRSVQIKALLPVTGVVDLDNKYIELEKAGSTIELHGVKDPAFKNSTDSDFHYVESQINELLLRSNEANFKLLLSHRPELFSLYSDYNLTLTGHAHGGQIRFPFVGGIVAPNQGFFPKYDSGEYGVAGAIMIVSRGIANSIIPQRIFNRPEIVVVTLETH